MQPHAHRHTRAPTQYIFVSVCPPDAKHLRSAWNLHQLPHIYFLDTTHSNAQTNNNDRSLSLSIVYIYYYTYIYITWHIYICIYP